MALLDDLKVGILKAASGALSGKPQVVVNYLKVEGEKLALTLSMIADGVANKTITQEEAVILLNQQKVAATSVLTASVGMSIVTAQKAVNDVLAAVRDIVNSKLPFPLL